MMKLYSYWRSTAAYRVRIGLELKGLEYEYIPVNLVKDGGEQKQSAYREKNPQGLVPLLETEQGMISQSLAILRYLENSYPEPSLFGCSYLETAAIDAFALAICCDIHPLNNLRVIKYLETELGVNDSERMQWYHHWLREGFNAAEVVLAKQSSKYCFTEAPSVADICLVAQVYNANRFNFDLAAYPEIRRINELCLNLVAFQRAIPENQPDAN